MRGRSSRRATRFGTTRPSRTSQGRLQVALTFAPCRSNPLTPCGTRSSPSVSVPGATGSSNSAGETRATETFEAPSPARSSNATPRACESPARSTAEPAFASSPGNFHLAVEAVSG